MAVGRQQQFPGQMRVDSPHLRMLEAGVTYDFDVLAGRMFAGRVPTVIRGFTFLKAGAVGNDAEELVLRVGGAMLIHYDATDAGSVFKVDDDRDDEVLGPTNARVSGSFTPSTVNYVGLDLVRSTDDSTADTAQFLVPSSNTERSRIIPMARTMDYRIVVSTTEFSATPGVAPLAQVTTDVSNRVVEIKDARWLMFRLGSGGSNIQAVNPFSWPGGRNEADANQVDVAGDRSIFSFKEWLNAAMTRIWELGGGEYWYSLTADRNVRMASVDIFASTGEPFEYVAGDLHWTGIHFIFDNSTGHINEVEDQLVDSEGLTDIADGECIYVDLDRTQNRTVAGTNPIVAQKAVLQTLGGSSTPGQRFVMAWRAGSTIHVRDQNFAVGSSTKVATSLAAGTVLLSADPDVAPTLPRTAVMVGTGYLVAKGLSHYTSLTSNNTITDGDIQIGLGVGEGDQNVVLYTSGAQYAVEVVGGQNYATAGRAALEVAQDGGGIYTNARILNLLGYDNIGGTRKLAFSFETGGAIGLRNVPQLPETPTPGLVDKIRMKIFPTDNGMSSPDKRDLLCVMWWDGSVTPLAESPPY